MVTDFVNDSWTKRGKQSECIGVGRSALTLEMHDYHQYRMQIERVNIEKLQFDSEDDQTKRG